MSRRPQQRHRAPRLSAHHTKPQQLERAAWRLVIAELTDDTDKRRTVVARLMTSASVAELVGLVGHLVTLTARALTESYGEAGAVGVCAKRLGELAPTSDEPKTVTG
jgi:hypothetical protein